MTRKDYLMDVRVYNNNLLQAIKNAGYTSVPKFCKAHDLDYGHVNRLLAMKMPILTRDRKVHPTVLQLLLILNKTMYDLFNEQQMEGLETNRSQKEVDAESVFSMMYHSGQSVTGPEELVDQEISVRILEEVLADLTPKERAIIKMNFGIDGPQMSLEAIGEVYDLSGSRINQIVGKALRKLRHPVRAGYLRHALLEDEADISGRYLFVEARAAKAKQQAEKAAREKEEQKRFEPRNIKGPSWDLRNPL